MKIFGNWKMYLNHKESVVLANTLANTDLAGKDLELAVFPSALSLVEVKESLKNTNISIGTQNCAWAPQGAYTGAVSALMYKEAGCEYSLVGHSERRHVFGESDEDVRKKLEAILDAGLTAVLCVGETKEDRAEDKVQYRLKKQLMKALEGLEIPEGKLIVAYEPVWAIGTGDPCKSADANDIHNWIKEELKQYLEAGVPVLYGGSVNPENVVDYVTLDAVDGVLVGGASVKIDSFKSLVEAVKSL